MNDDQGFKIIGLLPPRKKCFTKRDGELIMSGIIPAVNQMTDYDTFQRLLKQVAEEYNCSVKEICSLAKLKE